MMLCTAKNRKRVNQRRRIVPTQPMKKHRTIITKNLRNHRSIPRHSRTIANPYFENSNSEYLFRRNSVCMEIFTQSNFSSLPGVEAAHFTEQKCNQKPSQDYGNIPWPLLKFVHCEKKLLDYFPHVGQSFGKSLPPENFKMTGFCFSCFALTKSTNCSWRGHDPKSDTSFCWKCLVDKKSLCGIGNAILCKKAPIMAIAMWSVRNGPGYDDMKKKYNEVNGENMYFKGISTPLNVETHDIKDCIYWIKDNQVTYWNAVDDVLKKKKNKNRVSINHAESSSFITDSPTTSSNSISFYQHGQTTNSSGPNMMEIPTIITQEDAHDEETNGFTEASSYIQNNERKQYRNVPTASSTSWPKKKQQRSCLVKNRSKNSRRKK